MSFPVTINGNTYTEAMFIGYEHLINFPNIIEDVATVAEEVSLISTSATVISVESTTKTIGLSDAGTIQQCSNGSAQTITIPLNASVAFDVGTIIIFEQHGVGQVTLDAVSGVTLNGINGGNVSIDAQYLGCYIRKTATNTWVAIGGLA